MQRAGVMPKRSSRRSILVFAVKIDGRDLPDSNDVNSIVVTSSRKGGAEAGVTIALAPGHLINPFTILHHATPLITPG